MDPFDLMCLRHPLPVVRSSTTTNELDFSEGLIDKILGTPEKIQIPERYIPEQEPELPPEEEKLRSQKAERICRLLSKSNGGNLPLVLPPPPSAVAGGTHGHKKLQRPNSDTAAALNRSSLGLRNGHHELVKGHHHHLIQPSSSSVPSSPVRRIVSVKKNSVPSSLKNKRPNSSSSSLCDWSLAGVLPPQSSWSRDSSGGHSSSSSSSISASERLFGAPVPPAFGIGEHSPIPYEKGVVIGGSKVDYFKAASSVLHNHPSRSSSQSSSSGRSSASTDREDLLHLQQYLAREVTEKSRIVAIRALASSPSPPPPPSVYREPSPPSPVTLPTVQQREGFFT